MAVWCLELLLFLPTPPLLAGDAGTWAVGGGGAVFPSLWHHLTRGVPRRGLPTDRYMWSDATGLQECTKASTKPPSLQWTWVSPGLGVGRRLLFGCLPKPTHLFLQVSDWFVDFSVPGGTDPEGWQYASDFPA